jgi:hypothetical protein
MGVITISRGSYSKGKATAEKLAQLLGYECISRDILLEKKISMDSKTLKLTQFFWTPEIKDFIIKRLII